MTQDRKDGIKIVFTLACAGAGYTGAIISSNPWSMLACSLAATACAGVIGLWVKELGKDNACRKTIESEKIPRVRISWRIPRRKKLPGPENRTGQGTAKYAARVPSFLKLDSAGHALSGKHPRREETGNGIHP